MSIEQNRELVRRFFDCFSTNDVATALSFLSDDATWWIAGRPEQLPAAGSYSKEKIARLFQTMAGQLPGGLKMTIKDLIAEGDRVALEVESLGQLQNGRVYNQQYHFLITIRDEKIYAVREYLDTQHVFSIWFQP